MRRRLHRTLWLRGSVTFLLVGALLLCFSTGALVFDYARIDIARSEAQGALQLASHWLFSQYDERLFQEYGLYAIPQWEAKRPTAEQLVTENFSSPAGSFFSQELEQLQMEPLPNARLSHPEELEAQILGVMKWHLPKVVLEGLVARFEPLRALSRFGPVLEAKLDFETGKEAVQAAWESMADALRGATSSETQIPLWKELPSLENPARQVSEDLELARSAWKAGRSGDAQQAFHRAIKCYEEVASTLGEQSKKGERLEAPLRQWQEGVEELNRLYASWGETMAQVQGTAAQTLYGEYMAARPTDLSAQRESVEEIQEAGRMAAEQLAAWESLSWQGERLASLDFTRWKERANQSTSPFEIPLPPEAKKSHAFSESCMDWQRRLLQGSAKVRRSFWESLGAWNERRKLKARIRAAQRTSEPLLEGTIWSAGIREEEKERFLQEGEPANARHLQLTVPQTQSVDKSWIASFQEMEQTFAASRASLPEQQGALLAYWMGVFSHRLSSLRAKEKEEPTLFGRSRLERTVSGVELEYLLEGAEQLSDNWTRVLWKIAGLRFVSNAIYAMSDSQLRSEVLPVALALAGWTGFGVPIVQSGLLLLLALGETWQDVDALLAGERVPIYKTNATWRFSLQGVASFAQEKVGDLFQWLEDEARSGVEAAVDGGKEAAHRVKESLLEGVCNTILNPLRQWVLEQLSMPRRLDRAERETQLSQLLRRLQEAQQGTTGEVRKTVLGQLQDRSALLVDLVEEVQEQQAEAGLATGALLDELEARLQGLLQPVLDAANEGLDAVGHALEERIHSWRNLGEEKARQVVRDWLGEESLPGQEASEMASGLSMNYEDHLLLFLFLQIQSEGGKRAALLRTARLIHCGPITADLTQAPTGFSWTLRGVANTAFLQTDGWLRSEPIENGWPVEGTWKQRYVSP